MKQLVKTAEMTITLPMILCIYPSISSEFIVFILSSMNGNFVIFKDFHLIFWWLCRTEVNKGYAFVNFTNTKAVKKFHNVFHHKAWEGFRTPKICEIVCAKIQVIISFINLQIFVLS